MYVPLTGVPPIVRTHAFMLAAASGRDWRTCFKWLLGYEVRQLSANAIERAATELQITRVK